jgi:hypothetical protein
MIFYIASYPRSGNSWVKGLITHQFGMMTTTIHRPPKNGESFKAWAADLKRIYNVHVEMPRHDHQVVRSVDLLKDWIIAYDFDNGKILDRHSIIAGSIGIFSAEVRKVLASDQELFFMKTHLHPYETYFDGEYVIQPIRHPGATLWSYFNFFQQVKKKDVSLLEVIAGSHGFGDWSIYHEKWNQTAAVLGDRMLRVKYEDLHVDEIGFIGKLQSFLNLPVIDPHPKPFSHYQTVKPKLARSGKISEWLDHYSQQALDLLAQRHGRMMKHFSYVLADSGGVDS